MYVYCGRIVLKRYIGDRSGICWIEGGRVESVQDSCFDELACSGLLGCKANHIIIHSKLPYLSRESCNSLRPSHSASQNHQDVSAYYSFGSWWRQVAISLSDSRLIRIRQQLS